MHKTLPISVRLQPALNDQLAAVAQMLDRPKSWVISQAVADYVAVQSWQLAAIREGLREADAGKLISHDEVLTWVESWGTDHELPMPRCD